MENKEKERTKPIEKLGKPVENLGKPKGKQEKLYNVKTRKTNGKQGENEEN